MTFCPDEYKYWVREYPMFMQWVVNKGTPLFPPMESKDKDPSECYDLTSKLYVLMKRLKQDYITLLKMPTEDREQIFQMEMALMKKEEEESKKIDSNS